jgi:hypothetical protein
MGVAVDVKSEISYDKYENYFLTNQIIIVRKFFSFENSPLTNSSRVVWLVRNDHVAFIVEFHLTAAFTRRTP